MRRYISRSMERCQAIRHRGQYRCIMHYGAGQRSAVLGWTWAYVTKEQAHCARQNQVRGRRVRSAECLGYDHQVGSQQPCTSSRGESRVGAVAGHRPTPGAKLTKKKKTHNVGGMETRSTAGVVGRGGGCGDARGVHGERMAIARPSWRSDAGMRRHDRAARRGKVV